MNSPEDYVSIQQVLGAMAIKQNREEHRRKAVLSQQGPCPMVAYHQGQVDALKNIASWLKEYTDWTPPTNRKRT